MLRFRPVPHLPFSDDIAEPVASELRIGLDGPYELTLRLTGTDAGPPADLVPLTLTTPLPATELPTYSRVLLDVLSGDSRLSIREDEAEQAWRVLTPVLREWADGIVSLEEYPAGSSGPPRALTSTRYRSSPTRTAPSSVVHPAGEGCGRCD